MKGLEDLRTQITHEGGVSWLDAPKPRWLHRCFAQTHGYVNWLTYVERCPCGAIRMDNRGRWMERNSRKKDE